MSRGLAGLTAARPALRSAHCWQERLVVALAIGGGAGRQQLRINRKITRGAVVAVLRVAAENGIILRLAWLFHHLTASIRRL